MPVNSCLAFAMRTCCNKSGISCSWKYSVDRLAYIKVIRDFMAPPSRSLGVTILGFPGCLRVKSGISATYVSIASVAIDAGSFLAPVIRLNSRQSPGALLLGREYGATIAYSEL